MSSPVPPRAFGQPRPVDPGRRRRARLTKVALAAFPLVELALLIAVSRVVGGLATFGLLVVGAVAGVVVLRRAGAALARELGGATAAPGSASGSVGGPLTGLPIGRRPGAPAATALLVLAGLLLAIPGFLSDAVGLALLIPTVRRALAVRLGEAVIGRLSRMDPRNLHVVTGQVVNGHVVAGEVVDQGTVRAEPVHVNVNAVLVDPTRPDPSSERP